MFRFPPRSSPNPPPKCTNKWSNFDSQCCFLTCIYSKFSLGSSNFFQKLEEGKSIAFNASYKLDDFFNTRYNLRHVSNEQKKCWLKFVELRGQISYRVEARGLFYLQLLFTNAPLIPFLPSSHFLHIHIKFYLFILLNWQLCKRPLPFTIRLW